VGERPEERRRQHRQRVRNSARTTTSGNVLCAASASPGTYSRGAKNTRENRLRKNAASNASDDGRRPQAASVTAIRHRQGRAGCPSVRPHTKRARAVGGWSGTGPAWSGVAGAGLRALLRTWRGHGIGRRKNGNPGGSARQRFGQSVNRSQARAAATIEPGPSSKYASRLGDKRGAEFVADSDRRPFNCRGGRFRAASQGLGVCISAWDFCQACVWPVYGSYNLFFFAILAMGGRIFRPNAQIAKKLRLYAGPASA